MSIKALVANSIRGASRHLGRLSGATQRQVAEALFSTNPFSRGFGCNRGIPVDRYYMERFLHAAGPVIRGRVLEIAEDTYTRRFGGDAVDRAEVLHAVEGNPQATIVGDLVTGQNIPVNAFDAVICTQTVHCLPDPGQAIASLSRILKPGGTALVTMPGISQISRYDMDRWGDYWRFTDKSARMLFEQHFSPEDVEISVQGNVFAAVCLLHGLALEDVEPPLLDVNDPDYQVLICVSARRGRS